MKIINHLKTWVSSTSFLVLLTGCLPGNKQTVIVRTLHEPTLALKAVKQPVNPQEKEKRTITIWIHGTKGTARMLPIKAIKYFFNCKPGLNHWTVTDRRFYAHKIASTLLEADPVRFAQEDFYLFGWSGILSFQAREEASEQLYHALLSLLRSYQEKYDELPAVRLITHSHGGNVALLLAEMVERYQEQLIIDELILLACPVQDRTAHLTSNCIFKKIYSIYSSGDIIQIGDPQGAYKDVTSKSFFSRRYFPSCPSLYQTTIKFGGRPIAHVEFVLKHFLHLLPGILDEIDTWYTQMHTFVHSPHEIRLELNIKKR